MKKSLLKSIPFLFLLVVTFSANAQRGYYDAPYRRYEADAAWLLLNGAFITPKSYAQTDIQSEASGQVCVDMSIQGATVQYAIVQEADGLVIRYCVPDSQSATIGIYIGNTFITNLTLTSHWSWEYLWNNGNPNNSGVVNQNPRMCFDEVRIKLPNKIESGEFLILKNESGNVLLDFIELESVPDPIPAPANAAIYNGNGNDLQSFIDANGSKVIFLPPGNYSVNNELYFGVANTKFYGAGMWHTQINFTATTQNQGGLRANSSDISFANLYLTTNNNSRSNAYKAINGVFTSSSIIENIWAEHFECGAWIAQYNIGGPPIADGFTMSHCRFRNNYADGVNLCKGTSNAIVEHCNFRNNGDDDQAIWSADGLECINNTFRFNTSELCWRAAGVAIYGGKNNKAHNLVINSNLEAAIRVSNNFPGVGFNSAGVHEFYDISIFGCGTFNDLYNKPVGAIDVFCANNSAGAQVKNISFNNIEIINSKNDAIGISRNGADGIYNLSFKNMLFHGTGAEYPFNNVNNLNWGRGYFVLFSGSPNGNGTYCNMNYSNRGGNALTDIESSGIGTFSWAETFDCFTAIKTKKIEQNSVRIFPNPVQNELHIDFSESKFNVAETHLTLFDFQGKKVWEKTNNNNIENLKVTDFNKGIYFLKISDNESFTVEKIVVNAN